MRGVERIIILYTEYKKAIKTTPTVMMKCMRANYETNKIMIGKV